MDFGNISSLSSLLEESRQAQEKREDAFQRPKASSGVTVVKRRNVNDASTPAYNNNTAPVAVIESEPAKPAVDANKPCCSSSGGDIWSEAEIPTEDALLHAKDERVSPRYEFSYKQAVGTEDTFLGLGDKTPLSADCTHLVVKVHLPGASMKQLDLDVTKNRFFAASRTHRLFTYLPCDVDSDNGKAQFDAKKEVLTVTLPIVREF